MSEKQIRTLQIVEYCRLTDNVLVMIEQPHLQKQWYLLRFELGLYY